MRLLLGNLMLIAALLFSGAAHAETAIPALINDDEVRVRSEPSAQGAYIGVLYKNMLVTVLDQTAAEQKIGDQSHRWYKIRAEDFEGWSYGQYVSFDVPDEPVDTYQGSGDLEWFRSYFFDKGDVAFPRSEDLTNYTTEQYRNLINAFETKKWPDTWSQNMLLWTLSVTVYKHLTEHPDDPKYAYLKKKLYSDEFLAKITQHFLEKTDVTDNFYKSGNYKYLPKISDKDLLISSFMMVGKDGSYLDPTRSLLLASNELKDDEKVILAAVRRNARALSEASERLKKNKDFIRMAIETNAGALAHAPDEMRSDLDLTSIVAAHIKTKYSHDNDIKLSETDILMLSRGLLRDKEILADTLVFLYERTKSPSPRNSEFNKKPGVEPGVNPKFWRMFPELAWANKKFVKMVSVKMHEYSDCSFYGTVVRSKIFYKYNSRTREGKQQIIELVKIMKSNNRNCTGRKLPF